MLSTPPFLRPGEASSLANTTGTCTSTFESLRQAQEVDVQRPVVDRVERDVLGQGADGLAADLDHHDRVHEVAGAELAAQFLLLDVDRQGFFLAAINDGGYPAFATQCTGGSLASPIARFGGQGQSFAHHTCLSKCRLVTIPPRLQG